MGILNLAHGSLYALGAFGAAYALGIMTGGSMPVILPLAALAGILLAAAVGFVAETTLIRHMYRRALEYQLLITFGIA